MLEASHCPGGVPRREHREAAGGLGDGGVSSELHNIAMAVSQGAVPPSEAPRRLPEWVQLAEDLMAMLFMRWLAVALAQVWTLIGFLVVGSLALLLAISSYPFPFQSGLLFGMGLLIGALVLMILAIVVGFNRDELVSRLSNTAPNRLKLDQNLMGGFLTYIIPLAGAGGDLVRLRRHDPIAARPDPPAPEVSCHRFARRLALPESK